MTFFCSCVPPPSYLPFFYRIFLKGYQHISEVAVIGKEFSLLALAAGSVCNATEGSFRYEGHTLHCIEVDGEMHNAIEITDGQSTCRSTDANSCPSGFDVSACQLLVQVL